MGSFRGILLNKNESGFTATLADVDDAQLPADGDVTIAVEYSTINYKDGLAIANKSPVVRKWPMVAGIDGAGTVCLYSSTTSHVLVDVSGWSGAAFLPLTPARLLDTRIG